MRWRGFLIALLMFGSWRPRMARMGLLRSWLIRGLILAGIAGVISGIWVMQDWVSPDRVRDALITVLREQLPDVDVEVESANLRLLGGISITNLTLTHKGESQPFFVAPAATISHDKEQLIRGQLVIRKIELDDPTIRISRRADGTWNLPISARSESTMKPVPTLLVRNATVNIADERPDGFPPIVIANAKLNLLNDPVSLLKIEGQFTVAPSVNGHPGGLTVPMTVSAKVNRIDQTASVRIEVADLALTPDLAPAFAKLHPAAGDHLSQFSAHVGIKADLKIDPTMPLKFDLKVEVREGRYEDAALPWPLEHIAAVVQFKDNKLTVEKGTARFGKASIDLSLETKPLVVPQLSGAGSQQVIVTPAVILVQNPTPTVTVPQPLPPTVRAVESTPSFWDAIEDKLDRLNIQVHELPLDDELFAKLPKRANRARTMFSPTGTIDLGIILSRTPSGLKQEVEVRPNRLAIVYEKFKYPVQELNGSVKKIATVDGKDEFRVQMSGSAANRRVELTGRIGAEGQDPLIDLKLSGVDFPIDQKLIAAMPPKYATSLGKLQANGRGDFVVEIRQPQDVNRCENTFRIRLYDGTINYTHFPYSLSKIRGRIFIRVAAVAPDRPLRPGMPLGPILDTDRVELRDFEAVHANGRLWVNGDDEPLPGTDDRKLTLHLQGENLPLDEDFRTALATLKVGNAWQTLAPRGQITFGADVEIIERGTPIPTATALLGNDPSRLVVPVTTNALPGEPPFNAAADLKLTVNFKGPSVTPEFFPYDLDELAGVLRYAQGKIDLGWFTAKHGASQLALNAAEIRFGTESEVWANLGGVSMRPFVLNSALLNALPAKAREGIKDLNIHGPMDLNVRHLVVKMPSQSSPGNGPGNGTTNGSGSLVSQRMPLQHPNRVSRAQAPTSADPILYWNAELRLLGVSLDTGIDWQDVHGSIASVGKYEGTHLGAILGNAWFDRASIAKQPLTNVKMTYRVRPQQPDAVRPGCYTVPVLEFPDLSANLYQGTIGGEARVAFESPLRYKVWLTAAGVRLDELATNCKLGTGAELRGLAQGKLLLENVQDAKSGLYVLTGAGQIDVPNGRMYNLPVLLPLLKLLKLQAPDQTAFEEAHAVFDLYGDRVRVNQLDLIGTAVSLGGSGELDTKAEDVRFEFYTIWSQALKRWLTTPFGDVTSFLSGNLFKIEMVKKPNGAMEYRPHMLPVVTEPMKLVAERLRNRLGPTTPIPPPPTYRATGPR